MGKTAKIIIFIIVCSVVAFIAMALKTAGAGAVMSIAGVAIWILYSAMFSSKKEESKREDTEISLNKNKDSTPSKK